MKDLADHLPIGASSGRSRRPPWLLVAAYPLLWIALYTVSSDYWFLPAGLRVATLWLTPRRHWPWLAAAEWIGIAAITPFTAVHETPVAAIAGIFLPGLIYAAAVHEVRRQVGNATLDGVAYWVPFTLGAGLIGATFNAVLLTALQWLDRGSLADPVGMFLVYALGDYAGAIALAPLVVLAADQRRAPARLSTYLHRGWVAVPALGLVIAHWPGIGFPGRYEWFLVSIPLVAIGALCGRRPAVVALALLVGAFLLMRTQAAAWPPDEVQRILTVSGSAALLLGARRDAMHMQRDRLSLSIEELQFKTQALRDAAIRLSSQREEESRKLGLELHDQVGQDMTALATRLRIAERTTTDEAAREEFRSLQRMVHTAHDHLRGVIRHLHPIALERFGLQRALHDGPLAETAGDAGVHYECQLSGPIDELPLDVATALYRICQEAVTNGVRHGCGGELIVGLDVADIAAGRYVELSIRDQGGAIAATGTSGGVGLQGIRDRANALGATYRFDPASGQPRHWLRLVLSGPGGRATPRPRYADGGFAGAPDLHSDAYFSVALRPPATS